MSKDDDGVPAPRERLDDDDRRDAGARGDAGRRRESRDRDDRERGGMDDQRDRDRDRDRARRGGADDDRRGRRGGRGDDEDARISPRSEAASRVSGGGDDGRGDADDRARRRDRERGDRERPRRGDEAAGAAAAAVSLPLPAALAADSVPPRAITAELGACLTRAASRAAWLANAAVRVCGWGLAPPPPPRGATSTAALEGLRATGEAHVMRVVAGASVEGWHMRVCVCVCVCVCVYLYVYPVYARVCSWPCICLFVCACSVLPRAPFCGTVGATLRGVARLTRCACALVCAGACDGSLIDPYALHPILRLHWVCASTGRYIVKSEPGRPSHTYAAAAWHTHIHTGARCTYYASPLMRARAHTRRHPRIGSTRTRRGLASQSHHVLLVPGRTRQQRW
jgi:hypothetical protein